MSVKTYQVVKRPTDRADARLFYDALTATAVSGQALRVPLNGCSVEQLRNRCVSAMRTRGYNFHLHRSPDGDVVTAWATKKEGV